MSHRTAYCADAVRALEGALMASEGIDSNALMERAGTAAYARARHAFPGARRWIVLAGAGNNAGDGFVMARLAKQEGLGVKVMLLSPDNRPRGDAATQFEAARQSAVPAGPLAHAELGGCDLIVDAMLGIGLDRPLGGLYLEAAQAANAGDAPVVAIDIPTGIHADTGALMGAAVRSALTVTFVADKCGLFLGDAPDYAGRRVLEPLGRIAPDRVEEVETAFSDKPMLRVFTAETLRAMLPARQRADHKGRFGHVLVVAGGPGMGGAARLAGEGALRAGAGLVSVATHPEHSAALLSGRPELIVRGVRNAEDLAPLLKRATVVAVGCGLGQDAWADTLFEAAQANGLPTVVDADGLDRLSEFSFSDAPENLQAPRIITPHPGEAGRMLGISAAEVQEDRTGALAELRRLFGGAVLLKGAHTLISGSDAPPWVIDAGNPGMATAGMGDVLTGLLAGLWAQLPSVLPEDIAALASHVHACAGDLAARNGDRGLIASDLLAFLRIALATAGRHSLVQPGTARAAAGESR